MNLNSNISSDKSQLINNFFNNDSAANQLKEKYLANRNEDLLFDNDVIVSQSLEFNDIKYHFVENCIPCHNGLGYAPFSFTSYKAIKKKALTIHDALTELIMPPWLASEGSQALCNQQVISDTIRAELLAWLDAGCPLGAATVFEQNLNYAIQTKPDFVIESPVRHTISSDSNTYACFVFDPKFTTDTFVNAIQYYSDNADALHHVTLFLDTTGALDNSEDCWVCTNENPQKSLIPIDAWTKGLRPVMYRPEVAYRFPRGSKFMIQTHYESNHKGKKEASSLGLHFVNKPKQELRWDVIDKADIFIPANKTVTQTSITELAESINLVGFFPHFHFVCTSVEIYALTEDKQVKRLLSIPRWDYLLQTKYIFDAPISLPEKTKIIVNAVFDNTSNNPDQPNSPIRDMEYEHSAYDEMFTLGYLHTESKVIISDSVSTAFLIR